MTLLAKHAGYMHVIVDGNPHLAGEVNALRSELDELHDNLESINVRLEHVTSHDVDGFAGICADLETFLDDLKRHGLKGGELLQLSLTQEVGGSG